MLTAELGWVFPGNTTVHSSAADGRGAPLALTAHSTYQRAHHRGFVPDPGEADTKLHKDNGKPCSCDGDEIAKLTEPSPAAMEVAGKDFGTEGRDAAPCVVLFFFSTHSALSKQ